jgi:hypothetical protein
MKKPCVIADFRFSHFDFKVANVYGFTLSPVEKYSEFTPLRPLCDILRVLIVVAHLKQDKGRR